MKSAGKTGRLFIEGRHVGDVSIDGWSGSWGIGRFAPLAAFEAFKPMFAEWSQLMHADDGPMSASVSKRLRELENKMCRFQCLLYLVELKEWRQVLTLNVDGELVEWKEGWTRRQADVISENSGERMTGE